MIFEYALGSTRKRYCGHKSMIPVKFQATFVLTILSSKIYGVDATKETLNSERFGFFHSKIAVNQTKRFLMIYSNNRILEMSWVKRFLNELKLFMVSIPAYRPYVNAYKMLILIIKNWVRMLERKGTKINFRTFKKIIDKLNLKELGEWIAKCWTKKLSLII